MGKHNQWLKDRKPLPGRHLIRSVASEARQVLYERSERQRKNAEKVARREARAARQAEALAAREAEIEIPQGIYR